MYIIVANLSAVYSGRGESFLPAYDRILFIKEDGSVSIHNEKGFKPLNYMMSTNHFLEEEIENERTLTFSSKTESLVVTLHSVKDEIRIPLGMDDPGLTRDKTESQLQDWLSKNIYALDTKLKFRSKEFETGAGPVDILAEYEDSSIEVAIEVKRVATINSVGQILRYIDALEDRFPGRTFEGVIAAIEFKERTLSLASKKGIKCLTIPNNWSSENSDPQEKQKDIFSL